MLLIFYPKLLYLFFSKKHKIFDEKLDKMIKKINIISMINE